MVGTIKAMTKLPWKTNPSDQMTREGVHLLTEDAGHHQMGEEGLLLMEDADLRLMEEGDLHLMEEEDRLLMADVDRRLMEDEDHHLREGEGLRQMIGTEILRLGTMMMIKVQDLTEMSTEAHPQDQVKMGRDQEGLLVLREWKGFQKEIVKMHSSFLTSPTMRSLTFSRAMHAAHIPFRNIPVHCIYFFISSICLLTLLQHTFHV